MNARQKLGLITAMLAALSGVFFFDYSGLGVAWNLFSMTHDFRPRN